MPYQVPSPLGTLAAGEGCTRRYYRRRVAPFPIVSLFSEVRALTRDGEVPLELNSELTHRLERIRDPLRAETVATLALLASARRDFAHARALFESVWWFRELSPEVLECCFGWLVTDAAAEGNWLRVRWLLSEAGRTEVVGNELRTIALAPSSPVLRFFDQLAARVLGRPTPVVPEDDRYRIPVDAQRFAEGFRRGVREPVAAGQGPSTSLAGSVDGANGRAAAFENSIGGMNEPATSLEDSVGGAKGPAATSTTLENSVGVVRVNKPASTLAEPVGAALQALLAVRDESPAEVLEHAARSLATALASTRVRDRLFERATMIGGGDPDEALAELRTLAEDVLARALPRVRQVEDPLLRAVAAPRRAELIETLDARLDRLTDKCEAGTAPPMPEVWREFVGIRQIFTRAVALSEPGERGWPHHVALRLSRYFGTWLRLTKKQYSFARVVFDWLEVEAVRAGDETAARLARAGAALCVG